ncbi:MAG: hypothetical protein KAW17_03515 [Candidatus Eisenbacteria sp.]|nr:hypothetical protein [Candidatus Eisenbacteria bacterium]
MRDMWTLEKQETILAWARHLFWADLARRHLDHYAGGSRLKEEWQDWWHFFALLSQWYASEYVVLDGWREADLHDPIIDQSLVRQSDLVGMLRRYRNSVFHYQPNLIVPKFMQLLEESERSVFWVHYLHSEFVRYYWSYVNDFPGTPEQRSEFRESVLAIVGWIPDGTVEAKAHRLRQLAATVDEGTAGDMSDAAEELRNLAKAARIVAAEGLAHYRKQCRSFLLRSE